MSTRKKILLVSPFSFLPHRIASVRINGIASELSKNCDVDFFGYLPAKRQQGKVVATGVAIPEYLSGEPCSRSKNPLPRIVQGFLKRFVKKIGRDEWSLWALLASFKFSSKNIRYDYVIASSPPLSALLLASKVAKKTGAKLILDFRDVPNTQFIKKHQLKVIRSCFKESICCMTTSLPQASVLKKLVGDTNCILASGFYVGEAINKLSKSGDVLKIIYGGSLYTGQRDLSSLFNAIDVVTCEVELHLYLHAVEQDLVLKKLQENGVQSKVMLYDLVERDVFFEKCIAADVGLIVVGSNDGWVDHENAIPGKYFEYIRAGLKMLAISPSGSAIDRALKETEFGVNVDASSGAHDIAQKLEALALIKPQEVRQKSFSSMRVLSPLLKIIEES